jgi:ribonuclease HI
MYRLYFDGGSRGNPGISGCGAVLYDESMNEIDTLYHYCGPIRTNNYAEYMGLLYGIQMVLKNGINLKDVVVYGDSQLVIKQCKGLYRVRDPTLLRIYTAIKNRIRGSRVELDSVESAFSGMEHVLRHLNKRADTLSNIAMDRRSSTEGYEEFVD